VRVRAAVSGDARTLAALNRFVHDAHLARRPDYFRATRADDVAAWFGGVLDTPTTTAAWNAEEGDVPIGFVLAFFHDRPENPFRRARRWCEIDQIAVDPAWRRRGVGHAVMRAARDEADHGGGSGGRAVGGAAKSTAAPSASKIRAATASAFFTWSWWWRFWEIGTTKNRV